MHTMLLAEGNDAARAAGALTFYLLFTAICIWLIVSGHQEAKATQGRKGKTKRLVGWILIVLLVLGILGRLGQA